MTREHKIALIVGFALVMLVGVAVSDHLSQARQAQLDDGFAGGTLERDDAVALPLAAPPRDEPVRQIAPTVESRLPDAGPVGRALAGDAEPSDGMDWSGLVERLRDRITSMPTAAETSSPRPRTDDPQRRDSALESDPPTRWHSVAAGETFWSIARTHYGDGELANLLAAYNRSRAPDPDTLRAGVRLQIPPRDLLTGEPPRPEPTPPPQPVDEQPPEVRRYTIKRGDTLGGIAMEQLGTIKRMDEILALNPKTLRNPDIVPVGVTIKLPAR